MNRFKFQAMVEEFPFLAELKASEEDGIKVKRLDEKVLTYTPQEYQYTGSLVNDWGHDRWHAVMADGTVIENFVKAGYDFQSNYAYEGGRHDEGESVLEALDRLIAEQDAEPAFLVNEWANHDDTSGRDYRHVQGFTVYKPGRDVNIAALIQAAKDKAKSGVAIETDF